jgi:TfoX/Sxy family transcriptional regulator of competence genes
LKWKKVSVELSELLENTLKDYNCQKKMMFGCPAFFINNNMFSAVHQDNIVLRLSPDGRKELVEQYDEAEPFEPMAGRVMKEYMVVPETLFSDQTAFEVWLGRSYEYASKLPPKKKKQKKR